ncbi:hypothetical protein [Psychrobacter sp. JCM 18903]|uniref:hypothetical protein n=1 Tax=Psychrobacter sp. JCM 18903 TaxID=1298610 RepID=UPI0004B00EBA|nr:hypothetical protein [Psychrobacter sp. JCM 18903]
MIPSAALQAGKNASKSPRNADIAKTDSETQKKVQKSNQDDTQKNATTAIVRVLQADGNVVEQTVTVGINNRVNAQILSGLNEVMR